MYNNYSIKDIDVVILCGGAGTRLRPIISDKPKVLVKIGDKIFIDILIGSILRQGFKNMILCIGHLKNHIKRHFGHDNNYYSDNYNIIFSEEDKPLGTGGAIKNAEPLLSSNPFIVMNGDSICNVDFREFINFHIYKNAILSMVLTKPLISNGYGSVIIDDSNKIVSFNEKYVDNREYLTSAGVYIMQKDIFSHMPKLNNFSLEYDLFPRLCYDKCYGFLIKDNFIDIGTPERYRKATDILGR